MKRTLIATVAALALAAPATANASSTGAAAAIKREVRADTGGEQFASSVSCRTIVRNRIYRCRWVNMYSGSGPITDEHATVRQYGKRYLVSF